MHRRRPVIACPPIIRHADDGEQESFAKHRLLGYGGFAAVYEVERVSDGCRMAAKVLPLSSLADANKLRRVQNEIDINQLLHHPHVVTFLGSFQDEHNVYLLQELCCITLSELLKHVGRMSELQAAHILWQVISALEHLHGCRVAHRDLKLSNMFLARDGTVKVGDLGLASHLPTPSCRRRSTCGSLNWMAPEVLRPGQHGYGLEVDIWALGVVLFTLLVGRPPFAAAVGRESVAAEDGIPQTTYGRILQGRYRWPGPDEVALGPEARDLVARLLVVDPAARPTLEQLRAHAFFRVHLGLLAALTPRQLPGGLPQQDSALLERSGSTLEDHLAQARGPSAVEESLAPQQSSSSLQSPWSLPLPAADVRLLLGEAGQAALAASAAGITIGGACESTSGSYMELSQSEQYSVATVASITTTTATGGRCGFGDSKWQHTPLRSHASDMLTGHIPQVYDPSRARSQSQLPPYRMSEQITVSNFGLELHGGKAPLIFTKLFARSSVPNSPCLDPSVSISGTEPGCRGSPPSVSSLTQGTSGTSPTTAGALPLATAPTARLLSSGAYLASVQQPQPQCQPSHHYPSHHPHHYHDQHQQRPLLPASPQQQQQPQPLHTLVPIHEAHLQPPLLLRQSPTPRLLASEFCKVLPGGGADQDLPAPGTDVYRAHGVMAAAAAGAGPASGPRACVHLPVHARSGGDWQLDIGGGASSCGDGLGVVPERQTSWMRSYIGLSRQPSTAFSSRSTSQRSSAFVSSCAHAVVGPQHPYPHLHIDQQRHQHDDPQRLPRQQQQLQQQQQQDGPLLGERRRTIDNTAASAAAAADPRVANNGARSCSSNSVTGIAPGAQSGMFALRTAFLSQYSSHHATATAQTRRLQASRSAHARDSMRIAAGLRSVPGGSGLDEAENDGSSETVRSFADSLEAMLLGGNGRYIGAGPGGGGTAALTCTGPAPVMPSGMARNGCAHAQGYGVSDSRGYGHVLSSGLAAAPAAPSVSSRPVILRHARSSIGAPSVRRGIVNSTAAGGCTPGVLPRQLQVCATSFTSWPQQIGAAALHLAPCVTALSSGLAGSEMQSSRSSDKGATSTAGGDAGAASAGSSATQGAQSLPGALDPPRLPMPLPPYQPLPSAKPPLWHSSSASTTPQHSEPLSLAVFAIQSGHSKGLPSCGLNSPPPGVEGAILDAGLCICSAADSPLGDVVGWSGDLSQIRGRGPRTGSGTATMALLASPAAVTVRTEPAEEAIDAERAVANLELRSERSALTSATVIAPPSTADDLDRGAAAYGPRASQEEQRTSESQSPLQQTSQQAQRQLLPSELITRTLGGEAIAPGSRLEILSRGQPTLRPEYRCSLVYTPAGGPAVAPASSPSAVISPTAAGRIVGQAQHEQDRVSCQAGAGSAWQPRPETGKAANMTPGPRTLGGVWCTDPSPPGVAASVLQPSDSPVQPSQSTLQPIDLYGGFRPVQEPEQQELEQQRTRLYVDSGSGFSFRMHMHPWRAMALARVRQEAMRLSRLHREEVDAVDLDGEAAEGDVQALEEWGTTSSRSATSAAPLDQPLRLQGWEGSGRPTPCLRGPSAQAAAVATAADYSNSSAASSISIAVAAPHSDSGQRTEAAALAMLPGRVPPQPFTAAAAAASPAAAAQEVPWTASACTATRGGVPPNSAAPCATSLPAAAGKGAAPAAAAAALAPKPPSCTGWTLDRLGLCCAMIAGGCGFGNGSISPIVVDPSPYSHDGDSAARRRDGEHPSSKSRVTSLDVEQVLRHLESCDPDDMGTATAQHHPDEMGTLDCSTSTTTVTLDGHDITMVADMDTSRIPSESPCQAEPAVTTVPASAAAADRGPSGATATLQCNSALEIGPALSGSGRAALGGSGLCSSGSATVIRVDGNAAPTVMVGLVRLGQQDSAAARTDAALASSATEAAVFSSTASTDHVRRYGAVANGWDEQGARTDAASSEPVEAPLKRVGCCGQADGAVEAPGVSTTALSPSAAELAMAAEVSATTQLDLYIASKTRHSCVATQPPSAPQLVPGPGSACAARDPVTKTHPAVGTAAARLPSQQLLSQFTSTPTPAPGCRSTPSPNGMRDAASGAMPQDAAPKMDPEAFRLRSKSFKDGMGSRTGSSTYRPSRMMPAAHHSPSRRGTGGTAALNHVPAGPPASIGMAPDDGRVDGSSGGPDTSVLEPASGRSRALVHAREVLMVKWLDYSSKYGLSYVLSNGAVGVLFRDGTQMLRDRGDAYVWLLAAPMAAGKFGDTLVPPQWMPPQAQLLLVQEDPAAAGQDGRHRHDVSKKLRLLRSFEGMLLGSGGTNGVGVLDRADNDEPHPHPHSTRHKPERRERSLSKGDEPQQSHEVAVADEQTTAAAVTVVLAAAAPPPVQPPPVFVTWWIRTRKALVLCMSSGTLQALFCDGSELVLREAEDEVEYLARDGRRTSCSLRAARLAVPQNSVSKRIQYATMLMHSRSGKQ